MKKNTLSIIIPFYNEAWNVTPLIQEIESALTKDFPKFKYEIILIDDGSSDNTWQDILSIKKKHKNIIGIRSQRNYGQATTLQIGFEKASGEYIFTLDGDGQNNPSDFIRLYNTLQDKNLDVVAGWRRKRKDPSWMLIITRAARLLRGCLIKDWVHDSWCTLRIYKYEVVKSLELWGEMHRFIIALSKLNGYKIGEIKVDHRAREIWISKYNWKKSFKWLIDLIYIWFIQKYEWRPLHLFWFVWLLNFWIGLFMVLWALYKKLFIGIDISNNWFFIMWIFMAQIGLMLFIFGIVIDLLIRINKNTQNKPKYIIREEI